MTVVVSDLVARIRSEGVQETAQQIKAVGDNAQQTARALEIMAQAAAKSAPTQGSAAQILELFQKGNVQPTAAAMAQAASEMQKTAAAATQAAPAAQNLARAATEHAAAARSGAQAAQSVADGWKLSESSAVRFIAAITGVNVGLSIAAGAGRLLHDNIAASLEAAINLDRVSRGLTASYGAAGAAQAAVFAQRLAPQAGTTAATVGQALTAAAPLTQYGLTGAQTQALTARAADIAGRFGQPFDQVAADVVRAVQTGGNQLEQYGIKLDNARVKTEAYGGALSATFDRLTTSQQIAVRYNLLLDQTRNLQGSAATSADTLSGAYDRLGASLDRLREKSGTLGAGGIQGPAEALAGWINQIAGPGASGGDRRAIVPDPNAPGGARIIGGAPQFEVNGLPGATQPAAPPSFIGPVPLRGADLLGAQASNAQSLASRAQAEAQAQITAIQLQSEQRRLSVAVELAGYRAQELQTEGALAPLLEQQANLQNRITQASRDNLDTRRQLVSAEQGALGAQAVTSAGQYDQNMAQAVARQRMARLLQGQDVSDLPSLDQLIQQNYRGQLIEAENAPNLVRSQRGVEVTQQQATAQDLVRQQTLTDLEGQRRALEDQTTPLQEALRLTQEREASVQRSLELADLGNAASVNAAQQALNQANAIRLVADETARIAQDYSDHMVTGATALERAASAITASRDAINQTLPLMVSLEPSEPNRRILNGLGAGGLGPLVHVPITINGADAQQIKDQAHQAVENALNRFFGDVTSSAPPAPSDLVGARRR
jgi:hypothetical protein